MGIEIPKSWDKMWVGALFGIIVPTLTFFAYLYLNYDYISLHEDMFDILMRNLFAPLMSLCAVLNLGLFYLFLWQKRNYAANGIILSTIIISIVVFAYKFLVVGA
tara:strand:- start:44 stop:358 length:315 start_codon:yes stop_codon:yes gene_type:complete